MAATEPTGAVVTSPAPAPGVSPGPGPAPSLEPLRLVGFELSLRTARIEVLESASTSLDLAWAEREFRDRPDVQEVALLKTCHRVELFLLLRSSAGLPAWRAGLELRGSGWTERTGLDAVRHLFYVASGLESLAVGEREVRQQIRSAIGTVQSRHPRPVLRELLGAAVAAADREFPRVDPSRSIAAVAVSRLQQLVGPPFPRVVVVGSGVVGRQIAEMLAPTARVTLVYHRRPPDAGFLRSIGARAAPVDRLVEELAVCDAVVAAAKSGRAVITPPTIPRDRPVVLMDLGVPRNIAPEVRRLPQARLVDLGDLYGDMPPPAPRAPAGVEEAARDAARVLDQRALEPWVAVLRREVERIRRAELASARPYLGELTEAQEQALERLTRRLVGRLLDGPTERIRALSASPEDEQIRRWALELLTPDSPEP
ncbi:MAG: glutamyl-tRNA reductase [Thermoplasmata archaeon]